MADQNTPPKDILIIVDCEQPLNSDGTLPSSAVRMFAADPTIVYANQGSTELGVKVPSETNLRWRAVPLQMSQNLPEGQHWHVMITQVILWGAGGKQLNASDYLQQWFAATGVATTPAYKNATENFTFQPPSAPDNQYTTSNVADMADDTDLASQVISDPYVQATCTNYMLNESNYAAYSFVCTVYKGRTKYATVSWDPYVIVTLPEDRMAKR